MKNTNKRKIINNHEVSGPWDGHYKLRALWSDKENMFYNMSSISRFLIGREPREMRDHTTARVMSPCRECF